MSKGKMSADARAIRDKYNADVPAGTAVSTAERFEMIPIRQLMESPLNPRKHFNPHKLAELATSIKDRGIITPLIVRPAPDGMEIIGSGPDVPARAPMFEIGAGHRRFRSALSLIPLGGKGGLKALQSFLVPCRVLDLDDAAFLELLTIENDQREDVHPLEQADGYKTALQRNRYDVATLADKIGKPLTFVRGRLELCDLVPVVRESFLRDAISIGHARLISRLPADKQEEALSKCFDFGWRNGEKELLPVSDFRLELRDSHGADLAKAPFLLDARVGRVGPCTECSKCTGVQRSLLADDTGEQMCLDRPCYDGKVKAHVDGLVKDGFVQIAHSSKPPTGVLGFNDYVEAMPPTEQLEEARGRIAEIEGDPDEREQPGVEKELADLRKEVAELEAETGECPHMEKAVYVDGRNQIGKVINICRKQGCPVHGEDLDNSAQAVKNRLNVNSNNEEWQRQREKEEVERKINVKARKRAWEALLSAMGVNPKLDRFFLQVAASGFYHRCNEEFCKGFGIEWQKGDFARNKGQEWTETASDAQLARFIIAAAFWEPGLQEYFSAEYSGKDIWEMFCTGLAKFGTSFEKIEKQVRDELAEKAKTQGQAAAKKSATKKAAAPAKTAKSGKMAAAGDEDPEDGEE